LKIPNGVVVTNDALIVAETAAHRLTQFDIDPDGVLSNRRILAQLDQAWPDGICLDAEHAVWAADPFHKRVIRVRQDGVLDRIIDLDGAAPMSCALGGSDGRTLMVCVAPSLEFDSIDKSPDAWLEVFRVDVPGPAL
jgi:sugar lactone lactonase YvrE